MTLYLKYRPQTLNELDLESVRENLKKIVTSKSIPHAFLFSGPKGTGKTSAARILAKIINCGKSKNGEPCNTCESCLSITKGNNIDIIELDAASNRGIDDIRNLKSSINLAPANAKYKVYIIDEVHMLTLEAANAFLKTLEEPPGHVVFILATTNPEKLPATVISRLTRVDFVKANDKDIERGINRIAKGEKISITPGAIKKISKLADGSFRDAVKILENLSLTSKDIKEDDIKTESADIKIFFEIITAKEIKKALEFIENLAVNGINIKTFIENLEDEIHKSLLAKNGIGSDELKNFSIEELTSLNELISDAKKQTTPISQLPLEIAIIKFLQVSHSGEAQSTPIESKEEKIIEISGSPLDDSTWQKLLQNIRVKNVSIEALLRAARPINYDGKILNLGVYYQFHKERLEDPMNIKILEEIVKTTLQTDYIKVEFELIEKPQSMADRGKPATDEVLTPSVDTDIIDAAKEIFG